MAENSENLFSLTPVSATDSGVSDPTGQIFMFPSRVFPVLNMMFVDPCIILQFLQ